MEFPFYRGMSHDDIMRALVGNVSGENTQQLQIILEIRTQAPSRNWGEKYINKPLEKFVVTKANNEYALLSKLRRRLGRWVLNRRFMVGINDDDKFFIHPLHGYPRLRTNVTKIVKWMDRNDEGFTRVQGDLIMRHVPWFRGTPLSYCIKNPVTKYTNRARDYKEYIELGKPYMVDKVSFNLFQHHIDMRASPSYPFVGFHHENVNNYLVCMAQQVEITHPQHKTVSIVNDKADTHALLFTTQRGQPPISIGVD